MNTRSTFSNSKLSKAVATAVTAALPVLYAPIGAAQGDYAYQPVEFDGTSFTQVFSINERGQVAGTAVVSGDDYPFVYDPKRDVFTVPAPVAGYESTGILGISNSGRLVGAVEAGGSLSGLIIDKNGKETVFDHPDAVSQTRPRAINSRGLVAGFRDSSDDLIGPENGFIYDAKRDAFTDIVRSLFTIAQGINARGDAVGSAIFATPDLGFTDDPELLNPCPELVTPGGTVRLGWRRTADGAVSYFTVNGGRTSARGINDKGQVGGFLTVNTADPGDPPSFATAGFVTELDDSPCQAISIDDADLLRYPGLEDTFVQGIDNQGNVAGTAQDDDSVIGFIATPD